MKQVKVSNLFLKGRPFADVAGARSKSSSKIFTKTLINFFKTLCDNAKSERKLQLENICPYLKSQILCQSRIIYIYIYNMKHVLQTLTPINSGGLKIR